MGRWIDNMIGFRWGTALSGTGEFDRHKIESIIQEVVDECNEEWICKDLANDGNSEGKWSCLSNELIAHKGSYVVIAGIFNYWDYSQVEFFAKKLSLKVGKAMFISWEVGEGMPVCGAFQDGEKVED